MMYPKQITDNFSNKNTNSKMKIHIPEGPIPGVQVRWPRVQDLVLVIQGSGGSFASVDPCCLLHLSPSMFLPQCFSLNVSPSMFLPQCFTPFSLNAMYHNLLVWRRQDVWRAPGAASPTINPAFIRRRQLYTTFLAPDTLKVIQDVLIIS